MRVVVFGGDLMDQSKIRAAFADAQFLTDPSACPDDVDVVIVDLARQPHVVDAVRAIRANARIVAYGPHVDDVAAAAAQEAGADVVLPRSRFFRDIPAAVVDV